MNRGFRILAILLLVLLISGVKGCEKGKETGALGAYIGGTDGLAVSFLDDEPPEKVLDNNQESFFITLSLENKGEYDIPKGKIIASLSGIPREDFSMSLLDAKSANVIEGKHKLGGEILEGVMDELQFPEAKYKYDLSADLVQKMRADVCYLYQTEGLAKLCLKKNPSARDDTDICEINNEAVSLESSSAPVKVTNVKEQSAGQAEVLLIFDIENVGEGDVYLPDTFSGECSGWEKKKDSLSISVEAVAKNLIVKCTMLGDKSKGDIKLVSGKRKATCRVSTSALQDTAFESPFNIKLNYFYKVAIGKEILIQNL